MWCLSSPAGFPGGSDSKESASNAGDPGSIPGLGRYTGEGNSNPLQCSCLENSMDRGAWQTMGLQRVRYDWATNTFTFTSHLELHLSCWLPIVACHEFLSVTEICIFFFLTKTSSSFFSPLLEESTTGTEPMNSHSDWVEILFYFLLCFVIWKSRKNSEHYLLLAKKILFYL